MAFIHGSLVNRNHVLSQGLELWLPGLAPYAGGGRWLNIARPWNDGDATGAASWAGNNRNGIAFRGNGSSAYYAVDPTALVTPDLGMAIACSVRWTNTTVGQAAVAFGRSSSSNPFLIVGAGDTTGSRARIAWRNDANNITNFQSSANYNDSQWHRFFFWRGTGSGGNYRFSVDGVSLSTAALSTNPITVDRLTVGALVRNTVAGYWTGDVSDVMVWRLPVASKPLNELQMMRWDYEEWSKGWPELLNRQRKPLIFLPGGGGSYTLTSGLGTYSLSGQAATLRNARRLTSSAATYTLTGQTATLLRALKVAGAAGGFTLNGQNAGLQYSGSNPLLNADLGGFTLSGQTANLLRGLRLAASVGTLTESGQDVGLRRGLRLVIGNGTYTLSGIDANLAIGLGLIAGVGSFAVTGQDVGFLRTRRLASALGTFTLTGQPATLSFSGASDPGVITFGGVDLSLEITFNGVDLSRELTLSGFEFN